MADPFLDHLQTVLGTGFTLERELGGGGMSRVFVAEDRALTRKVVVKVLSPELAEGLSSERFLREIKVAASLQQANIVPVLWAGSAGALPYYAMPFVEGESLRHRLASGALPIHEVVSVLRDVSRALAYAHARGVVHRDIKPDNVLISGGAAVVTDFGIAKAISAARTAVASATLTQLGTSIGTPAYMAPEQAAGDPDVDHRADLYSLGCLAFELLAGRAVFAGMTPQRTLAAHMSSAPAAIADLRSDCPPVLANLIMRLLEKDPGARPQAATDVLATLDSMTTSGSSAAMPASMMGGPRRLWATLATYVFAFVIVVLVAKAAIVVIGLPEWVLTGAIVVMALGLPALLGTAYVQRVAHRVAVTTPTLTPGGTMSPRMPHGTMATIAVKVSPHVSWQRTIRGGYYALGTFIVVVAAFMFMRMFGIGPAASLFAAGTLKNDAKLLVGGFTFSPASDSALASILTEGVTNALGQSRVVRLLEPSDVASVMQQMKRTGDIGTNDSLAREVAERAGATAIVSGKVAHTGSTYVVSLSLRRPSDGAVLASFQKSAGSTKELLDVVDALTRKLRGKMGESLRTVNRSVPLEQATTSSLEALRRYSEGARANDVDSDFDRAVRALREAVAIDTTFALAWRKLGQALGNGRYPVAARDSAMDQAMKYADRLPDRERGLVIGAYYAGRDRPKSIAGYEMAYAADSNNTVAAQQLAQSYALHRDTEHALRYARREVQVRPTPLSIAFLARTLVRAGDVRGGQRLIDSVQKSGASLEQHSAFQLVRVATAYALGHVDSIRSLGEAMKRSVTNRVRLDGLIVLENDARLRGHLSRASQLQGELTVALRATGSAQPFLDSLALAEADIWYHRSTERGTRRLDGVVASFARTQRPGPIPRLATDYAMAGQPAKARAILATIDNPARPTAARGSQIHRARGEIALAERQYAEAIKEFRASDVGDDGAPAVCMTCVHFDVARVFDAANQPDSAIASFERYLAVPAGGRWDGGPEARHRPAVEKRLGELYDAKGDRVKAVAHYTTFVDLWKDADPELKPAVDAVRRRLKEIAGREGK